MSLLYGIRPSIYMYENKKNNINIKRQVTVNPLLTTAENDSKDNVPQRIEVPMPQISCIEDEEVWDISDCNSSNSNNNKSNELSRIQSSCTTPIKPTSKQGMQIQGQDHSRTNHHMNKKTLLPMLSKWDLSQRSLGSQDTGWTEGNTSMYSDDDHDDHEQVGIIQDYLMTGDSPSSWNVELHIHGSYQESEESSFHSSCTSSLEHHHAAIIDIADASVDDDDDEEDDHDHLSEIPKDDTDESLSIHSFLFSSSSSTACLYDQDDPNLLVDGVSNSPQNQQAQEQPHHQEEDLDEEDTLDRSSSTFGIPLEICCILSEDEDHDDSCNTSLLECDLPVSSTATVVGGDDDCDRLHFLESVMSSYHDTLECKETLIRSLQERLVGLQCNHTEQSQQVNDLKAQVTQRNEQAALLKSMVYSTLWITLSCSSASSLTYLLILLTMILLYLFQDFLVGGNSTLTVSKSQAAAAFKSNSSSSPTKTTTVISKFLTKVQKTKRKLTRKFASSNTTTSEQTQSAASLSMPSPSKFLKKRRCASKL